MTDEGGPEPETGRAPGRVTPPAGPDRLDVPADALAARLARRVEGLTRQLEARIGETEDLKRQLNHLRGGTATPEQVAEENAHKAAEYDALMNTLTMRLLRRPRHVYATVRNHLSDRRR